MDKLSFRNATIEDCKLILSFITVERKCGRLEWSCLDWNKPSIDFYLSMGAVPMDGWTQYRVIGDTLKDLACD